MSLNDCRLFLRDIILFENLGCSSLPTVPVRFLYIGMTLICTPPVKLLTCRTVSVWTCGGMQTWTRWFAFFSMAAMVCFVTELLSLSFQNFPSERVNSDSFFPWFSHQQLFSNWILSTVAFQSAICHHKNRKRG